MKTMKTALFLSTLAVSLMFLLSGCYTRVVSDDEDGTSFEDQDSTYQPQSSNYDEGDRYGDHTYVGFEYYTPSPYYGYDSWYYGNAYNNPWYYSSLYYGAGYVGYPFLSYPYYPYPYYSIYHHHSYGGYGYYGGYGSFAGAGGYGGARNSGFTRRSSFRGLFDNTGRGSSGTGTGYVSSPGSGYAIPGRSGNRTTNGNAATVPDRANRSSVGSGVNASVPTRGNTRTVVPNGANVPARGQSSGNQGQRASYGAARSGGYTRSNAGSRHEGASRPAYVPSYTPSRASAPHYSPPPSNSGRSGGNDNRSSGGSRGRGH